MPPSIDVRSEQDLELRCVHCGWGLQRLFMQYSPGNIRLTKCERCKCVADPYIECEFMAKAYRHLLYNMLSLDVRKYKRTEQRLQSNREPNLSSALPTVEDCSWGMLWKSSLIFVLLDTCRFFLLKATKDDWVSSWNLIVSMWGCGQVMADVLLGNFMFISVLLLGTRVLLTSTFGISRYKDILLAILVSSYLKLYLIAMLVWEFPSSVIYIVDLFDLSSNAVALRVITQSGTPECFGVCFGAHATKFFTTHWLLPLIIGSF